MNIQEALQKLEAYEKKATALNHASGLVYYDAATIAPEGSSEIRPNTFGELSRIGYELTTCDETIEMLTYLMSVKDELTPIKAREVSELYREYDLTRKVPKEEYVEYQMLLSDSDNIWHKAKATNDFALFEPYLQKVFDTCKKFAGYYDSEKDPYEVMLNQYERGLTTKKCDEFFDTLRKELVPLIKKVTSSKYQINDDKFKQKYPIAKQREFTEFLMDYMNLDRKHLIIGETEHPFTTNFTKKDVRITTHYLENSLASSLYSVVHEGGHALYELHTGEEYLYTCLGGGASMAIHESQSRFYENILGRSHEFCNVILPKLKEIFPKELSDITNQEFYEMINKSAPSLIRTDADELTYCLHVMIRYELEKKMFSGVICAKDLPKEWNNLYEEYLGLDVPDDTCGVLQDSHWSNGNVGYFPSYALGSAYGVQMLRKMEKDINVAKIVASGNLKEINDWLCEKIWRHGCMYEPTALFEMVCGEFEPKYYIEYLTQKFTDIYKLQ